MNNFLTKDYLGELQNKLRSVLKSHYNGDFKEMDKDVLISWQSLKSIAEGQGCRYETGAKLQNFLNEKLGQ